MIKVLGAGPAGLTAAITLAKANENVVVYERGNRPKPNFQIAVHSFRNYGREYNTAEKLEKIVKLPEMKKIYKVFKFSPSLRMSEIISKKPIFYTFLRGNDKRSLESVLLDEAKKLGAEFHFNKTIPEKEANIIATGAKRIDGIAFGYHYCDLNIEDAIYLFYDNRYAPHGYAYILPYTKNSGDVVTTIFCSSPDYGKIREYFTKLIKENEIISDAIKGATKVCEVSGYGNFNIPFSALNHGKLYVGEAAEFQDASKGFGVKFAILSGYLAAKSIINNENYDVLWKKELLDDLVYYFKRRIIYQGKTNEDFEKDILEGRITKENEEEVKRVPKFVNLVFPFYLVKWKTVKRI
ncbi:MAG: NAD(P)/FAD-dependent oxidoreductase [Candidatus Aenigmatarchaeota archaeon]